MKLNRLLAVVAAIASLPLMLTGCSPECVDLYDCAAKAKANKTAYTCETGVCKPGTPFVEETDAGTP